MMKANGAVDRRDFICGAAVAMGTGALAVSGAALAGEPSGDAAPGSSTNREPGSLASDDASPAAGDRGASWRVAPDPVDESLISQTKKADYVVVGVGHAGAAVLRSIAEDSAHTVIGLERQRRDSHMTMGNDVGHINSQWLRDHGVADVDAVEYYTDWMLRTLNSANPSLVMQWMQNAGQDIDWWLTAFDDDLVDNLTLAYNEHPDKLLGELSGFRYTTGTLRVSTAEHPDLSMSQMQQDIFDAILARDNAQIDFETTACMLERDDDGCVNAVVAQGPDGAYTRYVARLGVVLAAGDFAGDAQMRDDLLTHITDVFQDGRTAWSQMIMGQDGSGIKMGVWAGGRLEPRPLAVMNGDWCRGFYPQAMIWLDTTGRRYCNELFAEMPFAGKPMARMPQVDTWAIGDSKLADECETTFSAHDAYEPSDSNQEGLRAELQGAIGTGAEGYFPPVPEGRGNPGTPNQGTQGAPAECFCADTIEELADFIGYDEGQKANLIQEVSTWNEMCEAGVDTQYGKDSRCLFPIDTPPYYAFRNTVGMVGGIMVTLGGLMTDRYQNVLDEQCEPIPGLYATGNCCGQRFGNGYFTQTPGNSLGLAIGLGRELGKYLAAAE